MPRVPESETITLRIIAGELRSRKIQFTCDRRTRPMKDRTREAVMNLLGGTFPGAHAFDLFGGSGVLAFEAISRGAARADVWEILKPRASDIRRFAKELGIADQVSIHTLDVFRADPPTLPMRPVSGGETPLGEAAGSEITGGEQQPWVVFCCPPYAMWESQGAELRSLLERWISVSPPGSLYAVELELSSDETWLPANVEWDIRPYAPAKVAVAEIS